MIVKTEHTLGGQARIDGTRISVRCIWSFHDAGYSPERIQREYPHLELAQIAAAIEHGNDHPEDVAPDPDNDCETNDGRPDFRGFAAALRAEAKDPVVDATWPDPVDALRRLANEVERVGRELGFIAGGTKPPSPSERAAVAAAARASLADAQLRAPSFKRGSRFHAKDDPTKTGTVRDGIDRAVCSDVGLVWWGDDHVDDVWGDKAAAVNVKDIVLDPDIDALEVP